MAQPVAEAPAAELNTCRVCKLLERQLIQCQLLGQADFWGWASYSNASAELGICAARGNGPEGWQRCSCCC